MLPDVPPGPKWTHEIAMVDYDYLSDGGRGFENNVKELARLLAPEERRRVALCYHGWYETIGGYGYDDAKKRDETAVGGDGRTRKVQLSQNEVRRQLKLARDLGFRTLLYFADGLLQDSAAPTRLSARMGFRQPAGRREDRRLAGTGHLGHNLRPQPGQSRSLPMASGLSVRLAQGVRPGARRVRLGRDRAQARRHGGALSAAGLRRSGDDAAGEEAHGEGQGRRPAKGVPDGRVRRATNVWETVPGYSMVASGIYQDAGFSQPAWSCGLSSTWRNNLWICNWCSISQFFATRWGVQRYGVPVAISNGWGDDKGPSEWAPVEQQKILKLFRQRLTQKDRIRCLAAEPKTLGLHQSDPIPQPASGEVNWALAAQGGKATASSTSNYGGQHWGPSGLIDGRREKAGWGNGHGWASESDQPLPQWVEIDFPQPRSISRFVVVTYHGSTPGDTAEHYGVTDYEIQVWDEAANGWKTVVTENRWRAMKTRVHQLKQPVRTAKFRIVISRVAPEDGVARLVQLEAWGGA